MNLPVALIVIPDLFHERRQSDSGLRGEWPAKSDHPARDFHSPRGLSLRIQRERKITQCRHRGKAVSAGFPNAASAACQA